MAFYFRLILRHSQAARFNRRMRQTACPVVWEGGRAKSRPLDPIALVPLYSRGVSHLQASIPDEGVSTRGPRFRPTIEYKLFG